MRWPTLRDGGDEFDPCPNCGGEPVRVDVEGRYSVIVKCPGCGSRSNGAKLVAGMDVDKVAVVLWNVHCEVEHMRKANPGSWIVNANLVNGRG